MIIKYCLSFQRNIARNSSTASGYAEKRMQSYDYFPDIPNFALFSLSFVSFCLSLHESNIRTMQKYNVMLAAASMLLVGASCASHYQLASVDRSRLLIDRRYDATPDAAAATFIMPYRHEVDSVMRPVVGRVACYMAAKRPESQLSNLLADILLWCGPRFNEKPDFAVDNMGGIRAALAEGDVTLGDIVDMAPFENKICFLTLSGTKVLELFGQIAHRGGEAVSHGVEMVITKDGKLVSAKINGEPVEPARSYRVATLDYVAQGNDQMEAFKTRTNMVSPQGAENNVRFLIVDYFKDQTAHGIVVAPKVEGRIVVE